jgi:hypothetical protein
MANEKKTAAPATSGTSPTAPKQTEWLLWLVDAPMFIDDAQVERFYDAVVRPPTKEGLTTLELSKETADEVKGSVKGEAGLDLGWLAQVFPFLKAKAGGSAGMAHGTTEGSSRTVELHPIENPTRQLVQLCIYYLAKYPERAIYADGGSGNDWDKPAIIDTLPRALLALNLPGAQEAKKRALPATKLIPVAAEFTNGTVVTYFDKIRPKAGESAPAHPDLASADYAQQKKTYWKWYADRFEIQPSIELIEASVREQQCRIQWIDFRVPISPDGETLHLHIAARGQYDTITFAYNFIRRGYEFGIRLIGLLKTDPDLNVLAIYER